MDPEGEEMKQLSKQSVTNARDKGKKRAAGDLIPWTLCQHFLDDEFPTLCGARNVRVAVHTNFQGMGYGSRSSPSAQLLRTAASAHFNDNSGTMPKWGCQK
ncbi:hypothetical protein niasHS_008765 [Heterodera schachtii]|uniref:N-acetyltransferase domain-containing protein n=1 Tax=Heterodera schachtii TaxID=97005 RepID=A0ABD2J9Z4_HETSC